MVYTAFQLTMVFFAFLISNFFHFNGIAEYILDILKNSSSYWKQQQQQQKLQNLQQKYPQQVEFLAQQ